MLSWMLFSNRKEAENNEKEKFYCSLRKKKGKQVKNRGDGQTSRKVRT